MGLQGPDVQYNLTDHVQLAEAIHIVAEAVKERGLQVVIAWMRLSQVKVVRLEHFKADAREFLWLIINLQLGILHRTQIQEILHCGYTIGSAEGFGNRFRRDFSRELISRNSRTHAAGASKAR